MERDLTTDVWRIDPEDFPSDGSIEERARFLLRYAVLAPSSHNSQPWAFVVRDDRVEVHAVEDRWLDAADRDKRELYLSLGCAVENFRIAAEHFGLDHEIEYHDDATPVCAIGLQPGSESASDRPSELFDAITDRYTNHHLFEERALGEPVRERLRESVIEGDVTLVLVHDSERKASIAELQAEADRLQMEDPAYREELGYWIGIGALGSSWLKARIGQAVVTHLDIGDREARRNSKLIQSAPTVGVLLADSDAPVARVKTGQAFERLALAATSAGVATHPMSQILERADLREDLASLVGSSGTPPQHLFRLGYPTEEQREHTPRWPLETFLVEEA